MRPFRVHLDQKKACEFYEWGWTEKEFHSDVSGSSDIYGVALTMKR